MPIFPARRRRTGPARGRVPFAAVRGPFARRLKEGERRPETGRVDLFSIAERARVLGVRFTGDPTAEKLTGALETFEAGKRKEADAARVRASEAKTSEAVEGAEIAEGVHTTAAEAARDLRGELLRLFTAQQARRRESGIGPER